MRRKILIVDDSEIDRKVLRNILGKEFVVTETVNAYTAMEQIMDPMVHIDAILLDISMPILDGFDVLKMMEDNKVNDLPVFMMTAEATKNNVVKASHYSNVMGFLKKPFNAQAVLDRLYTFFSISKETEETAVVTDMNLTESLTYVNQLVKLYQTYLYNHGRKDYVHSRAEHVMSLLLHAYKNTPGGKDLDDAKITLISKAVYLCDLGQMLLPASIVQNKERTLEEEIIYETHTSAGARIVRLNHSADSQYFVDICSEICQHHHKYENAADFLERLRTENAFVVALASVVFRFEDLFSVRPSFDNVQFDFILNEMMVYRKNMNKEMVELFFACENEIINYYKNFFLSM